MSSTSASRSFEPTLYGPALLSSLSRMIATDQRGSAGGGANMIASSFRFSDVRIIGGGGGGPESPVFGCSRIGGQVEQKMFRLRISSTCFVYTGAAVGGAATRAGLGVGPPVITIFPPIIVAVARAR